MLTVRPTASTSTGSIMAASRQVFNTNSKAAVIHAMINHGYSFNTFENIIIRCCDSLVINRSCRLQSQCLSPLAMSAKV